MPSTWQKWSEPINLGDSLNTVGTEMSFFIPEMGRMAYFSSTQDSEGMGDIFQMAVKPINEALSKAAEARAKEQVKPERLRSPSRFWTAVPDLQ